MIHGSVDVMNLALFSVDRQTNQIDLPSFGQYITHFREHSESLTISGENTRCLKTFMEV